MRCGNGRIEKGKRAAATQGFLQALRQVKNAILKKRDIQNISLKDRVNLFFVLTGMLIKMPRMYASLETRASWRCARKWAEWLFGSNADFKHVLLLWVILNHWLYLFKWYLYENELTTKDAQHAFELVKMKILPSLFCDRVPVGLIEIKKIYDTSLKQCDWSEFVAASGSLFNDRACQLLSALFCFNTNDVSALSVVLVDFVGVVNGETDISIQKVRYVVNKLLKSLRDWMEGYCDKMCAYGRKMKDVRIVEKWCLAKQSMIGIRSACPCLENEGKIAEMVGEFCRLANEAGALTCAVHMLSLEKMSEMPKGSLDECRDRAAYFKRCIELHDGYRVISEDTTERELQLMFWFAWYGTKMDVNRECADGLGQCDYAISCGKEDKCIVEIKLGSNSLLSANLENQLKTYKKVNDTTKGIYLILCKNISEINYCRKLAKKFQLIEDEDIFIIDATSKVSASKRK